MDRLADTLLPKWTMRFNISGGGRDTEGARAPSTAEKNGVVIELLD